MQRWLFVLGATVLSLASSGCVGQVATPAVHGKAYVVKGSWFGTTMYNCDASGGEPECWAVKQEEVDQ